MDCQNFKIEIIWKGSGVDTVIMENGAEVDFRILTLEEQWNILNSLQAVRDYYVKNLKGKVI